MESVSVCFVCSVVIKTTASCNQNRFDSPGRVRLARGMSAKSVQPSMGCGYVVFVILLAGGLALLGLGVSQLQRAGGRPNAEAVVPGVIGAVLTFGSLAYLRFARSAVRAAAAEAARRAQFPDQPWKWKKEWQQPVIEAKTGGTAVALWIFAVFWNGVSAPAAWAFFTGQIKSGAGVVVLLFPLVGLGLLWAAIYQTVRHRKYGRTRFVPSGLPGVIGGYLGGVIEVPARVVLEADARLSLKCIRRETRGSGKNRRTTENVLWEREELIAREKWVTGLGGTRIPVLFYIPAGQPDTDDRDRNNEIVWRLAASAATPGVDFATQFDVPVFATGETAAPPEAGTPMLEEYQVQKLDVAALAACGVRREGDTFHFTSSHLPGTRFTTAVISLGFVALFAWFLMAGVPGPVWGITIFFALIVALFALDVWCARYELRIEATEVVVTKPRPWGTKVVRVPRAEVAAVRQEKSMSSGESQYLRLKLVGAEGADSAIPGAGESFLVRKLRHQMEAQAKKTGRPPPPELLEKLGRQPKFSVVFAKHIPGQARAEQIGALVLEAIRGN